MKKIEIDEQKKIAFDILCYVDEFCNKHDIHYFLTGGTLLGAIRHKGYIPWDDDIDITIPREDYIKLCNEFNKNNDSYYRLLDNKNTMGYIHPFAKIVDTRTLLKETTIENVNLGVFIDVFPIEAMDASIKQIIKCNKKISEWRKIAMIRGSSAQYDPKQPFKSIVKKIRKSLCMLFPQRYLAAQIENTARKYENHPAKYRCVIVFFSYGEKQILDYELFESRKKYEFEGKYFYGPEDYDSVLKHLYGDYMKLPPKNKQIPHSSVAWWIE